MKKYLSTALAVVALVLFLPAQSCAQLPSWEVPVFQYAVFYNLNLEVDPGAVLPIEGAVFSNAGIWSGTSNVTYASTVEAVGPISTNQYDPFLLSKSDSGTPATSFFYPGQPVSGVAPITLPSGYPSITNAEALINLPPSNVRAPQETAYEITNQAYAFNSASLIVSNWYWGTNGIAPWSNNFTVYLQDSTLRPYFVQSNLVPMNWIMLTNDYYIVSNRYHSVSALFTTNYVPNFQFTNNASAIRWTNTIAGNGPLGTNSVWYAGFSFLTNATFYDYREQATVQAVQLDVGKFGAWIATSSANGGSNWNYELSEDIGHGIDSVFIYNAVPFIGQQQLPAVRLINGWELPYTTNSLFGLVTSGLTVVTPQPMYVLGSYNVQVAGSPVLLGSHNTANTYPAALMADAITILSSNWSDSYNSGTSINSRVPTNTTINAACLAGIVPSFGENYSGGVENFLRLLEDWDYNTQYKLTYNGSMAAMFPSIYATNFWPGTGSVYNAPDRDWAFDTNFDINADLPPLTWVLVNSNSAPMITSQPTNATVLAGQTTNFIVNASGVPIVGYQWNFEGTNIPGATNVSLVLTNLQLTNAGDYSVQVTNVLGSVISSNTLLSVYTSAVPVLNALSFSPLDGAQFTVAGVPGFSYEVLASSNLVNWVPLTTSNSPFNFADTNTGFPQRFYRSVYIP